MSRKGVFLKKNPLNTLLPKRSVSSPHERRGSNSKGVRPKILNLKQVIPE